jgi:hypothetical protein
MNLAAEPQFPTKWPFPPAPPARRAWGLSLPRFRRGRRGDGFPPASQASAVPPSPSHGANPSAIRPSVPPAAQASAAASLSSLSSAAHPAASPVSQGLTVRQMAVDILLVAMWGAMIPVLMWLGAAAGF